MSEIAATFGAGTLLVFQPATADVLPLPVALGFQRLWMRRLREAGRSAVRFVAVGRLDRLVDAQGADATSDLIAVGDKLILPLSPVTAEAELAGLASRYQARWGLSSTFEAMGPRFRLKALLFEAQEGDVRRLEEHAIEDDNLELPRILFEILTSATQRSGVRPPWHHWSEIFTTSDPLAALHYLAAVGTWTMVEEGVRMTVADAFEPVVQALRVAPRMAGSIEVAEALVRELGDHDVASLALSRQLRRLRELGLHIDDPRRA
ncbi:MAG: hypothetical protein R3B09_10405 [Nannocystaceae bacterium]